MFDLWSWRRALSERWKTTKRDLAALSSLWLGKGAAPVFVQRPRHPQTFVPRLLRVMHVRRETEDALTLCLQDPLDLPIRYLPGQFFTVQIAIDGVTYRRAYSASTYVPDGRSLTLTCKRILGGLVSGYLHQHSHPAMMLQVLGPSGRFVVTPSKENQRRLVLIAGGSGITPLHCILGAVLTVEPESQITLIYGNRSWKGIIFADSLAELSARFPNRFSVHHILQDGTGTDVGVLDREVLSAKLQTLAPDAGDVQYFVCGPQGMMDAARSVLFEKGVPKERIFEEHFATPQYTANNLPKIGFPVDISHRETSRTIDVKPDETLLEAGLRHGISLPFSCTMGGCGACKGKLLEGQVTLPQPNCLTEEEEEAGEILLCVAHPTSPCRIKVE